MKITKIILLFFALSFLANLQAQDRHFTLFNFAPLVTNPAYTGSFEGTVRVGGLLREQAFSGPIDRTVYSTQNGFADAPLLNVRKRDWVGVGINFYKDKAGTFGLGWQTQHLSIAYHMSLDKKRNSVLTLGLHGGTVGRTIGKIRNNPNVWSEAIWPESQDGRTPFGTQGSTGNEAPNASFFDLGAGMMIKSRLNKTTKIELGFALQHITGNFEPGDSLKLRSNYEFRELNGNSNYRIPKTFVLHGNYDMELTDIWSLTPSFLFQQARNQNEAVLQFLGGYKLLKREIRENGKKGKLLKDKDAPKIRFGLGYRIGDAMQVLLGYEKGDLRVGIGYDLTLSGLADANGGNGAVEIAANYIFRIYKQPEVDPAILCPKF